VGTTREHEVGRAIAIAAEVHKQQLDKGNQPYVLHCLEVMNRARDRYLAMLDPDGEAWRLEDVMATAVLHDVLEDFDGTPTERKFLRDRIYREFPSIVDEALDHLTRYNEGETYSEYFERVAQHWLARLIKLCDLSHNLEAWRIPADKITERDYSRWDRYHRAFVRLMRED
jgi:(p)ppGpp synthase/HD superfamily hydrolase